MATRRPYIVTDKRDPSVKRLVNAGHPSTALMHVASATYDVRAARAGEVGALMRDGMPLEEVGQEQQVLEVTGGDAAGGSQ